MGALVVKVLAPLLHKLEARGHRVVLFSHA